LSRKSEVLLLEQKKSSAPWLSFLLFSIRHLLRKLSNAGMLASAKLKRRGKNQHHKKLHSLLGDARAAAKELGQS